MAPRRRDPEPRADEDAAVVDALIRQLRASSRATAPALVTSAVAPVAPRSSGLDASPRPRAQAPAPRPALRARRQAAVWARVGLGVVAAVAVARWPYERACGVELLVYLLAVTTVLITGFWAAAASWRGRLAAAHVVALVTILWSLALAAQEILPRPGVSSAGWGCAAFPGAPHPVGPAPLNPAPRQPV
jgi:hypothetical protein